jgi:hypothetical protein
MAHQHRATETTTRPFAGPVNTRRHNRAAHGNITRIDRCSCGAERRTNINGRHKERGPWKEGA